jgi:hypothetical protein
MKEMSMIIHRKKNGSAMAHSTVREALNNTEQLHLSFPRLVRESYDAGSFPEALRQAFSLSADRSRRDSIVRTIYM